jgi:hypothetical protein
VLGGYVYERRDRRAATRRAQVRGSQPTREVLTDTVIDERERAGIPAQRRDTPTAETDVANPARRTTP